MVLLYTLVPVQLKFEPPSVTTPQVGTNTLAQEAAPPSPFETPAVPAVHVWPAVQSALAPAAFAPLLSSSAPAAPPAHWQASAFAVPSVFAQAG